jgi:hypothetical protein
MILYEEWVSVVAPLIIEYLVLNIEYYPFSNIQPSMVNIRFSIEKQQVKYITSCPASPPQLKALLSPSPEQVQNPS